MRALLSRRNLQGSVSALALTVALAAACTVPVTFVDPTGKTCGEGDPCPTGYACVGSPSRCALASADGGAQTTSASASSSSGTIGATSGTTAGATGTSHSTGTTVGTSSGNSSSGTSGSATSGGSTGSGTTSGSLISDGGFCLIDGGAVPAGSYDPTTFCLYCNPLKSVASWTQLNSGACGIDAGGCEIDGVAVPLFVGNGIGVDPANGCQGCIPSVSTSAWSTLPDNAYCGVGNCMAGVCDCNYGATAAKCGNICDNIFDDLNCGACNNVCPAGTFCSYGGCVQPPSMSVPRSDLAVVVIYNPHTDVLLAIGGQNASGPVSAVEGMNTNIPAWAGWSSLPSARYGLSVASDQNGDLLVAGGYGLVDGGLTAVTEVDTESGTGISGSTTWSVSAPLPIPLAYAGSNWPQYRTPVIIGGENDAGPVASVFMINAAFTAWDAGVALPAPLSRLGSVFVTDTGSFVLGGQSPSGAVSTALQAFEFGVSGAWETPTVWPTPRVGAAMATDGFRYLYMVGGLNADQSYSSAFDIYDLDYGTWVSGPPLPTPRTGLGAAYDNLTHRLYAVGGYNGQYLKTVEAYVFATGNWAY